MTRRFSLFGRGDSPSGEPPGGEAADGTSDRLFEASPVGIVRVSADGLVLAANQAFATMAGDTREAVIGRRFDTFVATDDQARTNAALSEATTPPAVPLEISLAGIRPRMATLHVGLWDGAADQGDRMVHLVDVTAFKALESQVVQSRKMQAVGQLAGGIAHDFNNLLTAMIGFCDLLLQRHRAGDSSFADIMQIKQNANRAAGLVRQLLAFSRQQTLRPKVLDITDTLAELSHLLSRLIGQTVDLKLVHGRDLGLVKVDQNQFEQVVINLAVNARDAMPNGGQLTIRTSHRMVAEPVSLAHETMPAGSYVLIDVSDTGTGIPAEVIGHIFEPFFTTKPLGMGTGLGLSTVYGIVRQTGGFVTVDSVEGKGTTFSIYLPHHSGPIQADDRTVEEGERPDAETAGQGTILLVEDEDPVRLFAARALRGKGYKVVEARSGEAALELLAGLTDPLDLLITDAMMPVIDGPSLIRLIRADRPDLKVICISGHTDEDVRGRIGELGDVVFLPKPFSLKQLAARVKDVMERE